MRSLPRLRQAVLGVAIGACLCGLAAPSPAADGLVVETYDVGLMNLRTAASVVRPLLSVEGRVVEDERTRRLIVVDRPDVQRAVAAALRRVVTAARNVRILVATTWTADSGQAGGSVRLGRRPGASVGARESRATVRAHQQLLVLSGAEGEIRVAEEIPYAEWLFTWGAGRGLWARGVAWRDVATSLVVVPTVLTDGRIHLRITPQLEYRVAEDRERVAVHQLSTEVVVDAGEEVSLGGLPIADTEFRERFFVGLHREHGRQHVDVRVRATVD